MPIEFWHSETRNVWRITSPQLPGWACSAPTQTAAFSQCAGSLRSYLRNHPDLPAEIAKAIRELLG